MLLAGAAAALTACWGLETPAPTGSSGNDGRLQHGGADAAGAPIVLRDAAGNALTASSTAPYSPRATCGDGVTGCHDFSTITMGYHFQQGSQVVADNYNPTRSWLLSDGMYGKW